MQAYKLSQTTLKIVWTNNDERHQKDSNRTGFCHIQPCVVLIGCPAGQGRVHVSGETMSKHHTKCSHDFKQNSPVSDAVLISLSFSHLLSVCLTPGSMSGTEARAGHVDGGVDTKRKGLLAFSAHIRGHRAPDSSINPEIQELQDRDVHYYVLCYRAGKDETRCVKV